jgi:hypothetical protein
VTSYEKQEGRGSLILPTQKVKFISWHTWDLRAQSNLDHGLAWGHSIYYICAAKSSSFHPQNLLTNWILEGLSLNGMMPFVVME